MDSRIYILTHKRLTGQLSPMEDTELSTLLRSPQNVSISEEISYLWQASNQYFPQRDWNKDAAKKVFYQKINHPRTEPVAIAPANTGFPTWARMLALALIGLLAAFFIYQMSKAPATTSIEVNPDMEYATILDGTKVWVSEGAQLNILEDSEGIRKVSLLGEAFFDVTHDPERPFIIDLGDGVIAEVLGTSFRASSTHSDNKGGVSVRSGRVKLYDSNHPEIMVILEAGEVGTLAPNIGVDVSSVTNILPAVAQKSQIKFSNVPLNEVLNRLEQIYAVDFEYERSVVEHCRYSNVLPVDADLNETLASISAIHEGLMFVRSAHSEYQVSGTCE